MDDFGCTVLAHDHTVNFPEKRGDNIHFFKLGLGTENNMDTLGNIIRKNGHNNTTIEYLKVTMKINVIPSVSLSNQIDIEGHELTGLPAWLSSGALVNVNQLALEFYLRRLHKGPKFVIH